MPAHLYPRRAYDRLHPAEPKRSSLCRSEIVPGILAQPSIARPILPSNMERPRIELLFRVTRCAFLQSSTSPCPHVNPFSHGRRFVFGPLDAGQEFRDAICNPSQAKLADIGPSRHRSAQNKADIAYDRLHGARQLMVMVRREEGAELSSCSYLGQYNATQRNDRCRN